jgi:serine/threonine-protein kinase ULK2
LFLLHCYGWLITLSLQQTGALVAIKSVNLAKLNKKLKENLYSEIEILKGLHHPHIVALIDCRESTTHIHLVMEYCQLGDLSFFIKKRDKLISNPATADMARKYPNPVAGGLNEVITRHFLKQIASALQSLRERNLIHRDVKPQNLLLSPSATYLATTHNTPKVMTGSEAALNIASVGVASLPMLKIADFGFARSLPATSLAETLCGSPLYMAPEILRYEKYDAKADLWSVGTVLFEMMTGKPPFRASNHVELLRKIEQGNDVIKFPKESVVSTGMKALIRGLLKRNPVERMSFENFFGHDVVQETIPGLVADDRPVEPRRSSKSEGSQPMSRQHSSSNPRRGASERGVQQGGEPPSPRQRQQVEPAAILKEVDVPNARQFSGTPPPRPRGDRIQTNPSTIPSQEAQRPSRPPLPFSNTAPPEAALRDIHAPCVRNNAGGRGSQGSPSPGSSLMHELTLKEKKQPEEDQTTRDEMERAAQDVAFERDYVVVEKRAVEVNAFADEMAANPQLTGTGKAQLQVHSPGTKLGRQGSVKSASPSNTPAAPASGTRAVQIAQTRQRPDHQRQASYEKLSGSPLSATSAISKAIQGASLRLFGYTPPLLKGQSPPQLYSPFPAYPASAGISGLLGDGKITGPIDEDAKAVHIIEESATVSDVVYGFAEVKYKQLIPLAPSMDHGLGGPISTERPDLGGSIHEDEGLTPDAIVALSEEALVLYVKALALLAKSMDIASAWWARKNRGEIISTGSSPRTDSPSSMAAGNRINSAVQWVRGRFNEVLEKAEFVRLKLLDAQKQLPEDHPAHPINNTSESRLAGGASSSADGVVLSSGVTAEKLMYDRALEMSRSAAINEIANVDLPGCELSYITAIRMLEAVLENDDIVPRRKTGARKEDRDNRADDAAAVSSINLDDRQAVEKGVENYQSILVPVMLTLL